MSVTLELVWFVDIFPWGDSRLVQLRVLDSDLSAVLRAVSYNRWDFNVRRTTESS